MTTAHKTGLADADHYWRQIVTGPRRGHAYVSLLGLRTYDPARLHSRVRAGLSYEAFERLRRVLDLPASRLAELLRIPARTLGRRKESKKLDPEESDRLMRLSRLVGLALQLFEGDLNAARSWLANPHAALDDQTPLEFATTEVGYRETESLIGGLEHGVPL